MIIHCDTTRYIYEVLEQGEYSFLFDNLVVVDAGCNIGAFSLWIADRAKEIHAIDVSVENIENLNRTLKENGIGHIKTHCLALAGKDGKRWVSKLGSAGSGGWQIRDITGEGFEADAYSMKTFMEKVKLNRIDVLKLDVEGAEYEILNAEDFPADKITTIVGELHGVDIKSRLISLGYQYEKSGSHFIARR